MTDPVSLSELREYPPDIFDAISALGMSRLMKIAAVDWPLTVNNTWSRTSAAGLNGVGRANRLPPHRADARLLLVAGGIKCGRPSVERLS
jgi:hypothetical protein